MGYIEGHSREQMLLLPASVDDYVAADNPVRFIAAFVDDLDLGELGFNRSRPKATGRPGYDPADLLKLYLYGYLNRIRSSRCLAAEAGRNLEVIWLLGGLHPDFRTIADFRRANRAAFKPLFRAFVLLCRKLDLFGRELIAVDGTRLKAVNSRKRNFTQQKLAGWIKLVDERIEEYLGQLDVADRADVEAQGAARRAATLEAKIARMRKRRKLHQAMLAELVVSGESQLSLTDPDARGMAMHPKVGVGYNAQVAVDARYKLIVEQNVTNAGSDLGFLAETADAAREVLDVERIDAVADKGYYKGEDIVACEDLGVVPYVARPQRGSAVAGGYYNRNEFRYDPGADSYVCPAGERLEPYSRSSKDGHVSIRYTNMQACQTCALKPQCTSGSRRTIDRWENEAVLERMAERLAARPEILAKRREMVEHPFGSIKQWMNQGAFLMRGLASVNAEFSLTALAYNLRRAINILGVPALLRAVQA